MRTIAATSALLIGSAVIGCGTANAAPALADQAPVNYVANTGADGATVIRTDAGSMSVDNGVFTIKAADGAVLTGAELSFRVDDFVFPIAAEIHDRTATLIPQFDEAHAVYQPVALPFEDQAGFKSQFEREQYAWNRLRDTVGMGATVGTFVGGIGGAALGCLVGAGVAGVATAPVLALFGAGPLAGCLGGAAAVGFLGTLAGQLFVTAPVAIAAAVQYFTTINAPFAPPAPKPAA
ncbi:hypothetical protein [Nocardia aurantiaca]|uniref:DUF8020 domain-containing protein n=1 Tax=Nocardia aurantiaca TaxID=2675850 RepID=A0A6I3KXR5_9NOCA|nr:hypothetical protein [Nocardia aurantiaca]MTE14251.1 hypothetical protein [Nocardia aurantiaca]